MHTYVIPVSFYLLACTLTSFRYLSIGWYAHLRHSGIFLLVGMHTYVIPVSLGKVVTRSNCFFAMLVLPAYIFRSSTKELCIMSLVLSIPYKYALMFLSIKDNGLTVNVNSETDRVSP